MTEINDPTGKPAPLGYEFAYEILFATLREAERALQEIHNNLKQEMDLVQGELIRVRHSLRVAYTKAEEVRGPVTHDTP